MHNGLLCQTDETPDARDLYGARLEECDDCGILAATRGAAAPARLDDEANGEITWLVQAALGADRADARRKPPIHSGLGLVPGKRHQR